MPRLLTSILLFFSFTAAAQFRGLIINEFSQGDQGSREYIELLVVGHRTCSDSTADIRGWIVDDQNGWYGTTNISDGHYRFKDVPQWAAVPFGSIILLYNAVSGQKNLSITVSDDSTDINKDYVYVLPINTKTLLEEHDALPDNLSPNPSFVYPSATATAGYNGTSNLWIQHIALNNTGGDVLSVVSRAKRDSAFFSIGYGYTIAAGFRQPTVSIANVGTATNASLIDSFYTLASKWVIATAPFNETPGLPNGGINTAWVQTMRTTPVALRTYTTACSNGPYMFFGQTMTATGAYTVLSNSTFGCVDTNELYVVIKQSDSRDTAACDSLVYKGIKYTASTAIVDNISSVVINCDSIVRTLRIAIKKSSASLTNACIGAGQSYAFNGQTFSGTGSYAVTLLNAQGCDSVARLYLVETTLDSNTVSGCGSVTANGQTYTASAIRYDTIKSLVTTCDSIIRKTSIVVSQPAATFLSACGIDGTPYMYNGAPIVATGLYTFSFKTTAGCDSIVKLYVVFRKTIVNTIAGCDSVLYQNKWHFTNTTLRDTIKSLVSNCDSVINTTQLNINRSGLAQLSVCLPAGGSYSFFGQTLLLSGTYTHTLQTVAGCDSIIRLQLVIAFVQVQTYLGCDSVHFNGQIFYATTRWADTLRNAAGCDSVVTIHSIVVYKTAHSYVSACLLPGQTYNFNGQVLTSSGIYQTTYTGIPCDSVVHLYLVVAEQRSSLLRGCSTITYNGVIYTSSAVVKDTVKSSINGCDSIYRNMEIIIEPLAQTVVTTCIVQGATYSFNGQLLSATGEYTTTYTTTAGCDSTVNLYLVVSRLQTQTITGCERVVYRGVTYNASTVIADTIGSVVSGCDSLLNRVTIIVHTKPVFVVTSDTTICRGDSVALTASSPGATVNWTGFGNRNTITVSPQLTAQYTATVLDSNGCSNSAVVTVSVQSFVLALQTGNTAVLSGSNVVVHSRGNIPHKVVAWQPTNLFAAQTVATQSLYVDTSIKLTAIAQTGAGCRDTAFMQLTAIPLDDVYIPSGFTPNGDGRNEEVRVTGSGIQELDLKIFNRWGQLLFHTMDKSKGWNGMLAGIAQPVGVYVYVVRVKKLSGKVIEKKGIVTLIK